MGYVKSLEEHNSLYDKVKIFEESIFLNKILREAIEAYGKGEPILEDSIFDSYWQRLCSNVDVINNYFGETTGIDDLVILEVGYKARKTEHFATVKHSNQMGSLDNCFTMGEFESFLAKTTQVIKGKTYKVINFITEYKYDGFGLSLIYEKGYLTKALTRGDGYSGENIIANIRHVRNIPFFIKGVAHLDIFEVRGETFLTSEAFTTINDERTKNGDKPYVNARNAVAGIMRSLDDRVLAAPIDFVGYEIPNAEYLHRSNLVDFSSGNKTLYQSDVLNWISSRGIGYHNFTTNYIKWNISSATNPPIDDKLIYYYSHEWSENVVDDKSLALTLTNHIAQMTMEREDLPFEIDGIVVKVNNLAIAESLGRTSRTPISAIAWKFPPKQALGQLLSAAWQVGRTGIVTPVAEITPTYVGGVTVTRVTLHNPAEIDRLGIRLNDMVIVERRGDVIPKITGYSKEWRDKTATTVYKNTDNTITVPDVCPCCGTKLILTEDVVRDTKELRCINSKCKDQLIGSIIHFATREAMDIDGLGDSVAYDLVDKNLVKEFSDIYKLTKADLLTLEGFADKSANNLLDAIANSKTVDLEKFIYALGIPDVGRGTAKRLANHYKNVGALIGTDLDSLLLIKDIGPITAKSIVSWLDHNHLIVSNLFAYGIKTNIVVSDVIENTGKIFVLTGSFLEDGKPVSREQFKSLLEAKGNVVTNKVTSKTTALLVGTNPGDSKLNDAKKLGVRMFVIGEHPIIGFATPTQATETLSDPDVTFF